MPVHSISKSKVNGEATNIEHKNAIYKEWKENGVCSAVIAERAGRGSGGRY